MSYVELANIIEDQIQEQLDEPDRLWIYKAIADHEGPLIERDANYKGSHVIHRAGPHH